jgi:hypothetical protein
LEFLSLNFKGMSNQIMETNTNMDWILGLLALSILVGGLLMLFSGVREMGDN